MFIYEFLWMMMNEFWWMIMNESRWVVLIDQRYHHYFWNSKYESLSILTSLFSIHDLLSLKNKRFSFFNYIIFVNFSHHRRFFSSSAIHQSRLSNKITIRHSAQQSSYSTFKTWKHQNLQFKEINIKFEFFQSIDQSNHHIKLNRY